MRLKDILEVEGCNLCGSDFGYYTKAFISGWVNDNTLFEKDNLGEREKYNHGMFDNLDYGKRHRTCYCMDCDKPIGIDKS